MEQADCYKRLARAIAALRRSERLLRRAYFKVQLPSEREEIRRTRTQARIVLGYKDAQPWLKDGAA